MKKLLLALVAVPLLQNAAFAQGAPAGDAAAGKAVWLQKRCKDCHGDVGQGAFGPNLAGRGLSVSEFRQAVRKPWGIMPTFTEAQVSDRQIADLTAYFASLPKVAEPGKWRFEATADMAPGRRTLINEGCAQCHTPVFEGPRGMLSAVNPDFDFFADLVYNHTTALPKFRAMMGGNANNNPGNMGNYNPARVTPASLHEIYDWIQNDIGWRPPLVARLSKGEAAGDGVTYALALTNNGLPGKGLTAEGVTVRLAIPAGTNVVGATGAGYQGVQGNMAVWQVAKMGPKDVENYAITLSRAATPANNLKGDVHWMKPAPRSGPNEDVIDIAPPRDAPPGGPPQRD